ncbi:MAG: ABC transporter permease [Lachnospiraceae bacterium]|nr:ABC transporter permease [Lachnospiraceae bacterium]
MDSGVKNVFNRFSVKQIVCSLIAILSLLLFFILTIWSSRKVKSLDSQQAAARWDAEGESAQVSCFFSEEVTVDEMQLTGFRLELEKSLKEVLSAEEYANENDRRLIIDAYSSMGKITLVSEKGALEADAVGIGGDFFFFHPLKLVSGGYFSGEDLMKDSVIIDEEAAWQLFGSSDIAGQSVLINNVPHFVEGVIKREDGKLAERAGLDKTIVYVSNETLNEYGTGRGISTYEVVAPNPVKGYVYNKVKEKIGVKEEDMVVVENSSRYSVEALVPVILDFGMRSMQHTAVRFPYWENMARGIEDISALVLLLQFILLLLPIVIVVSFLITKWRKRTFSWRDVERKVIDIKNRSIQYLQSIKNKTKSNEGGK